jgi:DNA mismatch repair ATPase MutL
MHTQSAERRQIPTKNEEIAMIENPQNKGTKHMKLNFYINQSASTYVGGERNKHFIFIDQRTEAKRIRKKEYRKKYKYMIQRPLLETLTGIIEASKCKTLDQFTMVAKV